MLHLRSKKLTWALLAATFANMLAMRSFDAFLTNETCPNGIVSFEFAKTLDCATTILDTWDGTAKIAAGLSLGLDYLFLILYSSTIALLLYRASGHFAEGKFLQRTGRVLTGGTFLAAVFDGIENFALIRLLLGDLQPHWPTIAYVFAAAKFALLGLSLAYLLPGLFWVAIAKIRRS